MKWFESLISHLFPSILVDNTPWVSLWEQQQREQFLRIVRFFFPFVALGYVAHFYLFDRPMGLEPIEFWFKFRVTIAVLCLATFSFYVSPLVKSKLYKLPAILTCLAICYSQAKVTSWYGKEAWFFFFLFVLASTMLLRMSSLKSTVFGLAAIAISYPELQKGGVGTENIISGSMVTLGMIAVIRSATLSEVRNFLLNQENIANQRKMIEMNIEFADRIKSFIPRVIANRLTHLMEERRLSVVEASVEALKAKKKDVACLFTDIRGFTQGSKDINAFINESVVPEVKECSETIENLQGIPRKVGDLLFAYFDSDSIHLNILRALVSGIEIARINESMNATSASIQIRRYILVSSGEAMVGNFGGLDSSIEITALGSPVNFLSRVDELTKAPKLKDRIQHGDLIVCEHTVSLIREFEAPLEFELLDLESMNLAIRDFPEAKVLYRLAPSDENYEVLLALQQIGTSAVREQKDRSINGK